MMTRKDYVRTSEILNLLFSIGYVKEGKEDFIVGLFAEMFQSDNDRFDRVRFADACFVKESN